MRTLLLVLAQCLCLAGIASAQREFPTYVFAISAKQAASFYQNPDKSLDVSLLATPIDSFGLANEEAERASGHYLYVRPDLENLDIQLKSYYAYRLEVRNNDRDLALELVDAKGRAYSEATLSLEGRNIPYDQETQTYRRKNWYRDGLLSVAIDQDTLFYELSGNSYRPLLFRRINYWEQSQVGYWLTSPIRWVKQSYLYLKRGIGWGDWHFYRDPLQFLKPERGFRGYIAANQPTYRPGDTLRLKTYLTNKKGKPWKKEVRLSIWSGQSTSYRNRMFIDSILTTDDPGHFEFNWPLTDSLPLDQIYYLEFGHTQREKFQSLGHRFRLEDYELDEARFSLELQQAIFHRGEKIRFQAEGRDQNNQLVAGAEVQLTLMAEAISAIYDTSLSIPDTLWTQREYLRDQEVTQLLVPDSIFPAADLKLALHATFMQASGELHTLKKEFKYRHQFHKLLLQLEGDSIVAGLERNGLPQSSRAVLTRHGIQSEELPEQVDTISLPYQEVLSPYFEWYELTLDTLYQKLDLRANSESMVQVSGKWQPDTITISYSNPRRLNISWLLQTRTREIKRGSFSDSSGSIKVPVGNQKQWKLSYQYFWQESESRAQKIYRLDKQLHIEIEQPPKINPGETVQIKVKVQDQKGKAATGVQLAAAAVNAQFGNTTAAYEAPSIPYKTRRDPFVIENFHLDQLAVHANKGGNHKMTASWYRKLKLEGYPFYRMRYDNPGVWMQWDTLEQDTFYRNIAQVSPYLIKNGRALGIYLIYLNDELVYYFASQDDPPYSFTGRPGYNRIALRTREAEYLIDSVWLEKGRKLELAINLDHFENGMSGMSMDLRRMPPAFSKPETALLQGKTLVLIRHQQQKGEQYYWDKLTNIHRLQARSTNQQETLIVPFQATKDIHYLLRGSPERSFKFETGFAYDIAETRERLYQWRSVDRFQQDFKSKTPAVQATGELIYRPTDIKRTPTLTKLPLTFNRPTEQRISSRGRLRLLNLSPKADSLDILGMVLQSEKGTEWVVSTRQSLIGDLLPGQYQLFIVREDSLVHQQRLTIKDNATLAFDLSRLSFVRDTLRNWPTPLYNESLTRRIDREKQDFSISNLQTNPYRVNGQLIQGQITDDQGEPLIGASILIQGTMVGTVTDIDGFYSIWVPEDNPVLIVSYTGFSSQQFTASSDEADVKLDAAALLLDEVVVSGYGSMNKKQSTDAAITLQSRTSDIELPALEVELAEAGISLRDEFRDDAFWQPKLVTDQKGEAFFQATFPDNITAWDTYVLGMDRKQRAGIGLARTQAWKALTARLSLPRFLIAGDEVEVVGQAVNYTQDTLSVATFFQQGERELLRKEQQLATSLTDNYRLKTPEGVDSLELIYGLEQGTYQDGEQRNIPVFLPGSLETEGHFMVLHGDTSLELSFAKDLPINIFVADNQLELLIEDLDYLKNYPHECMEQTASRLIALSLEKAIRKQLRQAFDGEQLIRRLSRKLVKSQRPDGSWGWWPGNEGSIWITRHVVEAVRLARTEPEQSETEQKALRFLVNKLPEMNPQDKLLSLDLLSSFVQTLDYDTHLKTMDSLPLPLHDQLLITRIRQRAELPYQLDTLNHYRQQTFYGATYWGETSSAPWIYRRFQHPIATTLIAYELLRTAGREQEARRTRQYFLENRGIGQHQARCAWYNTFETARVLAAIIPDLLTENDSLAGNQINISGTLLDSFPYRMQLQGRQQLSLKKSGSGPLYFTAYQQYHNTRPESRNDIFELKSRLRQNERIVDSLEQGQPASLEVSLHTDADAEYVMLEIPIPAACSYGNRKQNGLLEDHREYRREKVVIYCSKLPAGDHNFNVQLEARFSGRFTLNPARAEQMYFPVLFGRNELQQIKVR